MPIPERLASALGDRYRLEKELGRGGTAVVYLAEDLKHHRQVAVKVLRSELAASLGPQRFLNEIDVAAKFTHPHILPLHDSGEADGFLYYVTPFIEGESLRQTLDREKQLPIEKAVRITQQVAAALDYAHRHGIVHRDIKPENILLQDGQSMVADFGIARALTACGGALTETGFVVGTPLYMSPEHLAGRTDLDGRADIYALGCVLYEMLAGEAPFAAPTAEATLAKRLTDAAPRVSRVRPAVPEAVDAALAKALARTPADRFATAARFAEALDITSTARTAAATLESTHPRWAWRRRAAVAFALVLASIGSFLGLHFRPRGNSVPTVPRLVVLPFENLGASEQEYFADGMTDEITARLAGLAGLAVIARQSAMLYKKSDKTPQAIGQELDAAYLLEATVSWQPGPGGRSRIRIRPQLIRASDGTQIWADVFDEDLTEVFAVQSRIASRVVEGLGVALVERERRSLLTAPTRSTEAHDSYLRGMQYFNQSERIFDARNTGLAFGLFEKAIELDPKFAHAYAALSRAHFEFYWWAVDRSSERLALAKRAADSALALDPELPEARMSLALYHYARLEYPAALKVLDELRAQEPHRAEVILYIGLVSRRQGNVAGAAAAMEDAARLSPRSPNVAHNLGESYWLLRNFEAAERELSRAISLSSEAAVPYTTRAVNMVGWKGATRDGWRALEPAERFGLGNNPHIAYRRIWLHVLDRDFEKAAGAASNHALPEAFDSQFWFVPRAQWLGEIYSLRNEPEVARVHFETARRVLEDRVKQSPNDPRHYSSLGIVYAALGNPGAGVQSARAGVDLLPMTKEAYRGAYAVEALARVYAMTGDRDAAVSHLTSLLSRPSHMSAAILRLDPRWDPLRGHQGFEKLLRQHER